SLSGVEVQTGDRHEGFGGFLHSLERGGREVGHIVVGEGGRGGRGLFPSAFGERVSGHAAVEDLLGVVYLAVADAVDNRGAHDTLGFRVGPGLRWHRTPEGGSGCYAVAAAAARAAGTRALSIFWKSSSVRAEDTNQVSN